MKYVCAKCKKPLDSTMIHTDEGRDAIAIELCEDCVEIAEDAVRKESYDEGHADGRRFPRGRRHYGE